MADISYLATLDGFSRRLVGWARADHRRAELVIDALTTALQARRPAAGLSHHSDHGCRCTALSFGQRRREAGVRPSMGSVGDACDNAAAARVFATLTVELVHRQGWPTRAAARLAIVEYIEAWYDRQRRQSPRAYATPAEYEAFFQEVAVA